MSTKGLACFGVGVLAPLTIIVNALLSGWILSVLWGWFIIPVFHLPALTIPYAIGISIVAGLLTHQYQDRNTKNKSAEERITDVLMVSIIDPLLVLVIAWVVKLFV